MRLEDFHNLHDGETALLVGNGGNLSLTPPELFDLPSFGTNTIYRYEGWRPTYFTGVDSRLMREDSRAINEKYADIPKFLPTPNLDKWQGENIYRFYHRPGLLWPLSNLDLWPSGILTEQGITYKNIMHVAMQLAYFMGFKTMLMIGIEHKPGKGQRHFWGWDHASGNISDEVLMDCLEGYKILSQGMAERGVKILNISQDTYVPEEVLPRADWSMYANQNET